MGEIRVVSVISVVHCNGAIGNAISLIARFGKFSSCRLSTSAAASTAKEIEKVFYSNACSVSIRDYDRQFLNSSTHRHRPETMSFLKPSFSQKKEAGSRGLSIHLAFILGISVKAERTETSCQTEAVGVVDACRVAAAAALGEIGIGKRETG